MLMYADGDEGGQLYNMSALHQFTSDLAAKASAPSRILPHTSRMLTYADEC
jgi:hypothetical protein